MTEAIHLPAPAKLNLFLHITSRRRDGYHNLQTLFQFLDHGDQLHFARRSDDKITLTDNNSGVAAADNLVMQAARALQAATEAKKQAYFGVDITLDKQLPQGAGLGGGSSDAATTLLGLNTLWGYPLTQQDLLRLGRSLGADVPIFIHGRAAFAEGTGEQFTDAHPPTPWYLVVKPSVSISTAELFNHPQLQRDCRPLSPDQWSYHDTYNVFEPVVCALYPEVAKLRDRLLQYAPTRLTGSGACLFARFDSYDAAASAQQQFKQLHSFVAQGQNRSPLIRTLTQK